MKATKSDPLLTIARIVVVIGETLMAIAILAMGVVAAILPFVGDTVEEKLRTASGVPTADFPVLPAIAVLLLALVAFVLLYLFLRNLRRIIDTVGEGDPFLPVNATRLTNMAWQMLAVQLLALPIGAIGMLFAGDMPRPEGSQTDWIHVDASLDFSGIVMVVVLFILARVFRQGAAMRADLEGTV
ncbi:DUF2975 domain-containing protein [Erythrobacter sp. 3-20A1M]|uniref:DUF2975 domain-containing protein n=1 Tax=Erythrobacter sp. 3-20A1M TaxID=2653850 RepID=UPI001BFC9D0E|nr:DUF2975 domain-containing protein [Erythrobacter sp. 3-20A1M]QWC57221.1 DUF2975 domain-containing protein [Erythrobacter sp. 3-20A1M]